MNFLFRNAWREIKNNRSFSLFYIVNLALGLVGFLTIDSFKSSLDEKVSLESRSLLGADFAIRARRPLTQEEKEKVDNFIPPGTKQVKVIDFYSMAAASSGRSRLVKVVAMEPGFPFYGKFELKLQGKVAKSANELLHNRENIWIYPELRNQLEVDLGEMIKIGEAQFRVTDFVMNDAGLQFQPAELAPKVFISKNNLAKTNLLLQGNTAFHNSLFKLPLNSEEEKIIEAVEKGITTPDIQIFSHQKAGHRAGRLLNYLSDFLSLVSLVALFLATLGSGYLFHGFIVNKTTDIAILLSLGATKRTAIFTYVIQLMLLGLFACLPALVCVLLLLPIVSGALQGLMPSSVDVFISTQTIILAFLVAILAGWLLALPSLQKIKRLNPANLFREAARPGSFTDKKWILAIIPAVLAFWGLTLFQSNSWKLGNLFFLCFLVSAIILYAIGGFCLRGVEKLFQRSSLSLRMATRSLGRNRSHSVTGFLALGLGVLLLNLIPQFQNSLKNELGLDNPSGKLPKLFLFDIQEDQVEPLQDLLKKEGHPLDNLTPWVRGKLLKVKGKALQNV
jgi:putative ABC transport system permease protein